MGGKDLSDLMIPSFLMDLNDLIIPSEWTWEPTSIWSDLRDLISPSEWIFEPTSIWTDLRDLISPKSWTLDLDDFRMPLFLMEAWSWPGEDLFRFLKIPWSNIGICAELNILQNMSFSFEQTWLSQISYFSSKHLKSSLFERKIFPSWFCVDLSALMTSASLMLPDLRKTSELSSDSRSSELATIAVVRNIQRCKNPSVLIRVTLSQGRTQASYIPSNSPPSLPTWKYGHLPWLPLLLLP